MGRASLPQPVPKAMLHRDKSSRAALGVTL
jgi:hypothetical protein